tara:strand:- start:211 stop:633 length:423 start_codon:yes stop_codon:yes gene_type:complete
MNIIECKSEQEIMETYAVMSQLRPHVVKGDYLGLIREMEDQGGRLIAAMEGEKVVGCAFFRQEVRLYTGPLFYVDDLVTDENTRSKGVGHALLDWVENEAKAKGIKTIALDSGVHREQGHKFYFREGFAITSFNFKKTVE